MPVTVKVKVPRVRVRAEVKAVVPLLLVAREAVYYTHRTLPTILRVDVPVAAGSVTQNTTRAH